MRKEKKGKEGFSSYGDRVKALLFVVHPLLNVWRLGNCFLIFFFFVLDILVGICFEEGDFIALINQIE